jgi:hypothetical protein
MCRKTVFEVCVSMRVTFLVTFDKVGKQQDQDEDDDDRGQDYKSEKEIVSGWSGHC